MDNINDIKMAFEKKFKDKTITKIVNYDFEDIYVIYAVPTDRLKERVGWLDGVYSMDRNSLAIIGGFNLLQHHPEMFSAIAEDNIIYEYKE